MIGIPQLNLLLSIDFTVELPVMAVYGSLVLLSTSVLRGKTLIEERRSEKIPTHQVGVFRFEPPVDSDAELVLGVPE